MCGARGAEVVVGSGIVATAISSSSGRGLSGALESDSDTMHDVCDASLYKNRLSPLVMVLESLKMCLIDTLSLRGTHTFYLCESHLMTSPMCSVRMPPEGPGQPPGQNSEYRSRDLAAPRQDLGTPRAARLRAQLEP